MLADYSQLLYYSDPHPHLHICPSYTFDLWVIIQLTFDQVDPHCHNKQVNFGFDVICCKNVDFPDFWMITTF